MNNKYVKVHKELNAILLHASMQLKMVNTTGCVLWTLSN